MQRLLSLGSPLLVASSQGSLILIKPSPKPQMSLWLKPNPKPKPNKPKLGE